MAASLLVLVYAALWIGYRQQWVWLDTGDDWLLRHFHAIGIAHPGWVTGWKLFCDFLGPTAFRLAGAVVIAWLLVRRRFPQALFIFGSVELSGLVLVTAKMLADRPRPEPALAAAAGSSFPSGHALGVMASVLALLTLAWPEMSARWRLPFALTGALVIFAIGAGRVVLNVHHPSDVFAGWALGAIIYLSCLPLIRPAGRTPGVPGTARQNQRQRRYQ